MAPRLPLLLTGAGGMVGRHLYAHGPHSFRWTLCSLHSVGATGLRRGDRRLHRDLAGPGVARELVRAADPAVVFHAAAVSSLAECERDPERSAALNVAATRELARACAEQGAYLIHCSTDQVFDGEAAPYDEDARPSARTEYGRQKAESERAVLEEGRDALVLRLALVLGPSRDGRSGALDMLRSAGEDRPVRLFEDEWRTPISVACLRRLVEALLESRPSGILNAGGAERVDRLELGRKACKAHGWARSLEGCSRTVASLPRPADVSLGTRRRRELGLPLPRPLDEALAELAGLARREEAR